MSSSSADVPDVAGSYRVCDTVVLFCIALACGVSVLALAVCFRRVFEQAGYAPGGAASASSGAAGRRRSSRRSGLAPSELAAIPKSTYRRCAVAGGWAQCAICLVVMPDGEVVRRLPACGHMFHVECIDTWLYSHPTCPLCRCDVGQDKV
ncbi:hypothetical protein QYE76_022295 [Lolium multiflorum]|uniref:RING-type E3 ubiquitin transferase n=1 Tax=Lolium multiflorum TaxID=4521 RepID=A0AAD8RA92_LOLMU|nr:hypothetical protein QYE76_022059 [Lolium multiflorum]KAK1616778.1 hypothetical protein QYE76_022295 [Lolium multiflorum]